ncbi:MAG: type 4a pilus biogenesis protein PilO [Gemmatimonas sp.]|nr:type 4a pilus biogenesis protein PilO [Gemmatimonas sp.]
MGPSTASRNWQRILLGILLFGGPGYLGYTYVYVPKERALTELESRVSNLEAQNGAARVVSRAAGERDIRRRIAAVSELLARVEDLVPTSEELPDLLDAIATEARRTGVDLALIQPVGELAEEFYVRRTYDLAALGDFHSIGDFLTRIGSLPRIVTPSNLQLRVREAAVAAGGPKLEARFIIETYMLPDTLTTREVAS